MHRETKSKRTLKIDDTPPLATGPPKILPGSGTNIGQAAYSLCRHTSDDLHGAWYEEDCQEAAH